AIANLNYRSDSVKQRTISAIRTFYTSDQSIEQLNDLDTDILIKSVWDVGDTPAKIKAKRRNFSSVKSSINADLEKLSQKGQNPENIIIAVSNVFDMTQEAKNTLLNSFTAAVKTGDMNLDQATHLLRAIKNLRENFQTKDMDVHTEDMVDQMKELLNKMTDEYTQEIEPGPEDDGIDDSYEDVEERKADGDDEFEQRDDDEDVEEDVEKIDLDEEENYEVLDTEEFEEIDALDEDEVNALEDFRKKSAIAEQFDETLGQREKKYNQYGIVPEGTYTIGTRKNIKTCLELQPFDMPKVYIGIYPICNFLFEIFIEQTGYVTTAEKKGYGRVYSSRFKKNSAGLTWHKTAGAEDVKGACWYHPSGPDSSLHHKKYHPVVQVSVADAMAFTAWIGRRIPTEAEWEASARTDMGYTYPWGNDINPKALNIEQSGLSDTCDVDEYDVFANKFGIVDLLGNVMEWTSDMECPPIKSKETIRYCVAKGGAWNAGNDVTISSRALFKNGFTSNTIGFRCISEIFL
ncbi:SUMF1/EgtB/PvdO family nonheme iron enzyme, partial [Desulfobacula sp.]|uniref:SUMF1/EgtB/PvdO family nonheme iron enzyme n=1 Tax=Desulfobacula sp. TaxID=2593537 RepID=UPI00261FAA3E